MNLLKELKELEPVEWVIIVACVGLVAAIATGVNHRINRLEGQETYQVWRKLYQRDDLTYEEWKAARRAGYLIDHHVKRP